MKQFKNF